MFHLPLTLSCRKLQHNDGKVLTLSCEVKDADGEVVKDARSFDVNVSASSSFEEVSTILQGYANMIAKDLLSSGQAERQEVTEEERMKDLDKIVGFDFIGAGGSR